LRWERFEKRLGRKLRREDFPRYAQSAIDEGMLVSGRLKDGRPQGDAGTTRMLKRDLLGRCRGSAKAPDFPVGESLRVIGSHTIT
jgi:hypothetical protein